MLNRQIAPQCAIVRDDEYYGTVGFAHANTRTWSDEEKARNVALLTAPDISE